jgi:hypothetical protein
MNLYQHLLFIVDISILFYFGVIRFSKLVGTNKCYPVVSGMVTGFCILLFISYILLNKDLLVQLFNYLGTL